MKLLTELTTSRASTGAVLIRLMVGTVFFFEGIQEFLYPDALGAGRFETIGIPVPHLTGPFVGGVETIGGVLLLAGLLTRLAVIPLLINISVAILSTKFARSPKGYRNAASDLPSLWPVMTAKGSKHSLELLGSCQSPGFSFFGHRP